MTITMILNFLWIVIVMYGVISSFRLFKVVKKKNKKSWTILYTVLAGVYSLTAIIFSAVVAYATAAEPGFNAWNFWLK